MQNLTIGVIGLGLIGGSFARAIRKHTPHRVLGLDVSAEVMQSAEEQGAIHGTLEDHLGACDILILALFPSAICTFLEENSAKIKKGTTVLDCGGIKGDICRVAFPLAAAHGYTFIGGHPMAGKEHGGFQNSTASLFLGASMLLVPPPTCDKAALMQIETLCRTIGFARVVHTTEKQHDDIIACTSQLAHVVSSAYIKSPTANHFSGFSAGSFRDMTRVARLNETMWTELFLLNRDSLLSEVSGLIERLSAYESALLKRDEKALFSLLKEGRIQKEKLDSIEKEE